MTVNVAKRYLRQLLARATALLQVRIDIGLAGASTRAERRAAVSEAIRDARRQSGNDTSVDSTGNP